MAAPDLTAIKALSEKAYALQEKNHCFRSAEKYGAAAEAAQALGAPDCLIVAHLQLRRVHALQDSIMLSGIASDEAAKASADKDVLLMAVVRTVERRMATATLLPGACRPLEEAFYDSRQRRPRSRSSPATIGFDTVYIALSTVVQVLTNFVPFALENRNFELKNMSLSARCAFVASGLQLAVARLSAEGAELSGTYGDELMFVSLTHVFMLKAGDAITTLAWAAPLLHGWRQLERSGFLQQPRAQMALRLADENLFGRMYDSQQAVLASAFAGAPLLACGLPSCGAREAHPQHFKSCAACRIPVYCCKEHQTEDWPSHKAACKAARKAAAAEDNGGAGPSGA